MKECFIFFTELGIHLLMTPHLMSKLRFSYNGLRLLQVSVQLRRRLRESVLATKQYSLLIMGESSAFSNCVLYLYHVSMFSGSTLQYLPALAAPYAALNISHETKIRRRFSTNLRVVSGPQLQVLLPTGNCLFVMEQSFLTQTHKYLGKNNKQMY